MANFVLSGALAEGESSSIDDLTLKVGNLSLRLRPRNSLLRWSVGGTHIRTADLLDFTKWTVTSWENDRALITLDNNVVVEAYSAGIIRFRNLGERLIFRESVADQKPKDRDGIHFYKKIDDDWWVAGNATWEIASQVLKASGAAITLFHELGGREMWLNHLVTLTDEDLRVGTTVNERLARTIRLAYWIRRERDLNGLKKQLFLKTAEKGALDRWGAQVGVKRKVGETDANFRVRVYGAYRRKLGGVTRDEIIQFVESATNANAGEVKLYANRTRDDSNYKPGYFEVEVSTNALSRTWDSSEFTAVLAEVEKILQDVGPAGVTAKTILTTDATYDTATYDSTAVYGS